MLVFTLVISCLAIFDLPWYLDLIFQVLKQYCSWQHWTLLPSCHIYNWALFFPLALSLHSFWSYFSTFLQEHIGHLLTWGVHLSVSYLFAFSHCLWGLQGKNTKVVCHSLLLWTTFCQALTLEHAFHLLNVAGWYARCPGCPTVSPHWAFKPLLAIKCWSVCSQVLREKLCWRG